MNSNASRTLTEFFTDAIKPLLAFHRKSAKKYHSRAVRLFLEFVGNPQITIGEITTDKLLEFDDWLKAKLQSKPNAKGFRADYYLGSILRTILYTADRERFERRIIESLKRRKAATRKAKRTPPEPPAEGSILHFFETMYRPKRLRSAAANTSVQYRMSIARFGIFLGRAAMLTDLNDDQVEAFLLWRKETGKVSAPTCNKDRCQLVALANLAARKGLAQFLEVQRENEAYRIPQAWTRDQLGKLFAACKETPGWIDGVRASLWWTAIHEVLWNTGERINAIRQLCWEHVNLETGWLLVPAEFRKFGTRDMAFKLGPETVAALQAIRLPERPEIFPWPWNPSYLWKRYGEILDRAGLPCGRKCKFHRMRRSVASHLEAAGGNAQAALGHSSSKVTEGYLDPTIVERVHPVDLLFRPDAVEGAAGIS